MSELGFGLRDADLMWKLHMSEHRCGVLQQRITELEKRIAELEAERDNYQRQFHDMHTRHMADKERIAELEAELKSAAYANELAVASAEANELAVQSLTTRMADNQEKARARIVELEARQIPDGWVAVPGKLTAAMTEAHRQIEDGPLRSYQEAWDLVLAAAQEERK